MRNFLAEKNRLGHSEGALATEESPFVRLVRGILQLLRLSQNDNSPKKGVRVFLMRFSYIFESGPNV